MRVPAAAIGVGVLSPALVLAVVLEGHFSGYADHAGPAPGVYAADLPYTAHAILNTAQSHPWYPWNEVRYEYTVVLRTVIVDYSGAYPWVPGVDAFETADFGASTVSIFEDADTPADYGNPGTFTDGTLILSGEVQDMVGGHTVSWSGLDRIDFPWVVTGMVVFTEGGGIDRLESPCAGGLVMNDFIDFGIGTCPPSYEEAYDISWSCPEATHVDESTWGRVKGLYR